MSNWLDPSFNAVSLALHVTVVVPTGKLLPDITTLPAASSHTMVVELMTPSTMSLADGNGDQVTLAAVIPVATNTEGTVFGEVTTGGTLSVLREERNCLS